MFLILFQEFSSLAQIQPLWQTYFGGQGNDYAYQVIDLSDGNVLIVGNTGGQILSPFDLGVNEVYNGGTDVFLAKFSAQGVLMWWTYYGSENLDAFVQIQEDDLGNIWLLGYTFGTPPVSPGAIKETQSGVALADCFISKFDTDGNWLEGTLLGGEEFDAPAAFKVNGNEIIIAGTTNSSGLATANALNGELTLEGEGFYAVLASVHELSYMSYLDAGISEGRFSPVSGFINDDGDLTCLAGFDRSFGNTDSWHPFSSPLEGESVVLMRVSAAGEVIFSSYYSSLGELGGLRKLDNDTFAAFGSVNGVNNVATNGAHQTELQGNLDALLGIWTMEGDNLWSTYLGGNDQAILVGDQIRSVSSESGKLYVAGVLEQQEDLSTQDAWHPLIELSDTQWDGFFGWFDESGALEYLTYLPSEDFLTTCNSIKVINDKIYLVGSAGGLENWIDSSQLSQNISGGTDVCLLAFDLVTLTNEVEGEIEWTVFPNPTTDRLFVSGFNAVGKKARIYSSDGKLILSSTLINGIDVSSLPSGSYVAQIEFPSGRMESKLFVKE